MRKMEQEAEGIHRKAAHGLLDDNHFLSSGNSNERAMTRPVTLLATSPGPGVGVGS